MKLSPLGDRVVLKMLEAEETTKSGIVLPVPPNLAINSFGSRSWRYCRRQGSCNAGFSGR